MKNYKINIIILSIVTALVFYFTLKDDFNSIVSTIANINIWWLGVAVLLIFVSWFFSALALYTLSKEIEKKFNLLAFYKSIIITNFFYAITPYAVGGQPFQIYYLHKKGMQLTNATNLIIEFFKLHQIALIIFGFIAVFCNYEFNIFPADSLIKKLVVLGFVINIVVVILLISLSMGRKTSGRFIKKIVALLNKMRIIKNKEKAFEKIDNYVYNSHLTTTYFKNHKGVLVQTTIYNFCSLAFLYIIPLAIAFSLGNYTSLNIMTTLVASAYVMLIGALIPVPGGSGGLEFSFAQFFGTFITGSPLMAILLLWRAITYYLGIIVGGVTLLFYKEREVK